MQRRPNLGQCWPVFQPSSTCLVKYRMSSSLQGQCSRDFRSDIVSGSRQLAKRRDHVHERHRLTNTEEMRNLLSKIFDQLLDHRVAANYHFVRRIRQPQIQFYQVKGLAFDLILLANRVDKNAREVVLGVEVGGFQTQPIFPTIVKLQGRIGPMLFCTCDPISRNLE
jgi:hypothetical protein